MSDQGYGGAGGWDGTGGGGGTPPTWGGDQPQYDPYSGYGTQPGAGTQPAYGAFPQQPAQPTPAAAPAGWYTTPDGSTAWWDGAQWHHSPMPSADSFYRPVESLGAAAQVLLVISAVAAGFAMAADFLRWQLLGKVLDNPVSVSYDELNRADSLAALAGGLRIIALIPTAAVFLVWLHRVYSNLDGPLRAGNLDFSAGWAVGWWFVPFANLVQPARVVTEAWKASDPGSAGVAPTGQDWRRRKASPLIGWWWACWIFAGLISRVAIGFTNGSNAVPSIRTGLMWGTVSSASLLAAAVLAVLIVRGLSSRQAQRAAAVGARQLT